MTKAQIKKEFIDIYWPSIEKRDEVSGGRPDYPGRRMLWNDYIDGLEKEGRITPKQAEFPYPFRDYDHQSGSYSGKDPVTQSPLERF
jgi:hypothetical protein